MPACLPIPNNCVGQGSCASCVGCGCKGVSGRNVGISVLLLNPTVPDPVPANMVVGPDPDPASVEAVDADPTNRGLDPIAAAGEDWGR